MSPSCTPRTRHPTTMIGSPCGSRAWVPSNHTASDVRATPDPPQGRSEHQCDSLQALVTRLWFSVVHSIKLPQTDAALTQLVCNSWKSLPFGVLRCFRFSAEGFLAALSDPSWTSRSLPDAYLPRQLLGSSCRVLAVPLSHRLWRTINHMADRSERLLLQAASGKRKTTQPSTVRSSLARVSWMAFLDQSVDLGPSTSRERFNVDGTLQTNLHSLLIDNSSRLIEYRHDSLDPPIGSLSPLLRMRKAGS